MPEAHRYTHILLTDAMMEDMVLPMQRRIYEQTGKLVTHGRVARQLMEKGFAAEMNQCHCHVESASN